MPLSVLSRHETEDESGRSTFWVQICVSLCLNIKKDNVDWFREGRVGKSEEKHKHRKIDNIKWEHGKIANNLSLSLWFSFLSPIREVERKTTKAQRGFPKIC